MKNLLHIVSFLKEITCKHLFRAKDMQTRNAEGMVKWECYKCKKLFTAECGLDILRNGKCDGKW